MDKGTRNNVLLIVGVLVAILLTLVAINFLGRNGIGVLPGNPAEKTYVTAPAMQLEPGKDYRVTFVTNFGDITFDLLEKAAPNTVNSFVFLAQDNYFDGTYFHRVLKDFVVQGGSRLTLDTNLNNDGLGGPGYRFANEINWDALGLTATERAALSEEGFTSSPNLPSEKHRQYSLSMANAGPNTNGSQFFIVTAPDGDQNISALNGKHTVFGQLIAGADVVAKLNTLGQEAGALGGTQQPKEKITLRDVKIEVR